jgi:pilus assembly protein Flp/PilA
MLYPLIFWAKQFFGKKEEGQTLIEYALLVVLIAIIVIVALQALGPTIRSVFQNINANLNV